MVENKETTTEKASGCAGKMLLLGLLLLFILMGCGALMILVTGGA